MAVCDAAGYALVDKAAMDNTQPIFASRDEVLRLLTKVPLPTFNQNKHEK